MSVKVSIIVPCYGVEKYLNRCMETLVNQTLRDIEIILVDDVSPDRVPEMCDDWAKKDERIKVIHKEKNGGLGYARNTGLEVATGDYVAFVDSDDYVDVTMYAEMYNHIQKSNADVVFCGYKKERPDGKWAVVVDSDDIEVIEGHSISDYYRDMAGCQPGIKKEKSRAMSVWHGLYRRSIIESNHIRFLSERDVVSEDIPFQIDFLKKANKVVSIPAPLYYYCLNGTSLTLSFYTEKYEKTKYMREVLIHKMGGNEKDINAVDRLFIGYVRRYFLLVVNSTMPNKKELFNHMSNDDIWSAMKKEYSYNNLQGYQKLHYFSLTHRFKLFLYFISVVAYKLKSGKGLKV